MAQIKTNFFDQLPKQQPYQLSVIGKLGPYALTHPDVHFQQYYSILIYDPVFLTPAGNEAFESLLKRLIYVDKNDRKVIKLEQYIMDTPKDYDENAGDLIYDAMVDSQNVRIYGHEEMKQLHWPSEEWNYHDSMLINNVSKKASHFLFDHDGQERYLKYGQMVRVIMNAKPYRGNDQHVHMMVGIDRLEISSLAHAVWYQ